jgi:hypothetical protein
MAVDFVHRIIIEGSGKAVRQLRRQIYHEYPKTVGKRSWIETVPFSFTALYELAAGARRIEAEIPCEPYDISAWAIRAIGGNKVELRYQLHTRNLELLDFIRVLSRAKRPLVFILVTLCLDDSSIQSYRLKAGRTRKWVLPQRRRDFHWNRAREKFRLAGDAVYDDEVAEHWAEEKMLYEALSHWDDSSAAHRRKRYHWWNHVSVRDLETEQELALYEIAKELNSKAPRRKPGKRTEVRRRKGKSKLGK